MTPENQLYYQSTLCIGTPYRLLIVGLIMLGINKILQLHINLISQVFSLCSNGGYEGLSTKRRPFIMRIYLCGNK